MSALTFGIIAAICWGIHDVCVRYLSQRMNIFIALFLVVLIGTILLAPIMIMLGTGTLPNTQALSLSAASGIAFAGAGIALYKAFSMGPVWLVAPIIGAYPILSMIWATMGGAEPTTLHWVAVIAVIAGIAIVATQAKDETTLQAPKSKIILWSIAAAIGWATTFAFGQAATQHGDPFDLLLTTRLVTTLCLLPLVLIIRAGFQIGWSTFALLSILGLLDATALAMILQSGTMANPEFASVAASTFGIITILLAWAFLGEKMRIIQWIGVIFAFMGIGYLAI